MGNPQWIGSFGWLAPGGGAQAYWQKVAAIEPASLIGYWRMNETSGTIITDSSTQANNGVYTGVDLANAAGPDGPLVAYWDGANDKGNVHSAGLATDWNPLELTIAAWVKVSALADWTDGATHVVCRFIATAGSNEINMIKNSNNQIACVYYAGGVNKNVGITGFTSTGWIHVAMTVSDSADELKAYRNGIQFGTTVTGLGDFAGAISTQMIGAYHNAAPTNVWKGWLAHAALWTTPLGSAQIASLAAV